MFKRSFRRLKRAAQGRLRGDGAVEETAFLTAAVDPTHYARQAGLAADTPHGDLVAHFLATGLAAGLSPSPLFPAHAPAAGSMRRRILDSRFDGPAEGWFDAGHYLAIHPDVARTSFEPFEHFLLHGLREGRNPSPLFDADWYATSHRSDEERPEPAFLRYLGAAPAEGHAPSRALLPVFSHRTAASRSEIERFGLVARAAAPWLRRLGPERFTFLVGLFDPYGYDGGGALGAEADGPERLAHFLSSGLTAGHDPGPLFQAALYRPAGAADLSQPGAALLHFLEHGAAAPAPTRFVDVEAYHRLNGDLPAQGFWVFRHLVMHGVFEGRAFDDGLRLASTIAAGADPAVRALTSWRRFWAERDESVVFDGELGAVVALQRRLGGLFSSPLFEETVRRARALDPTIGVPTPRQIVIPPAQDPREPARLAVLDRLPRLSYDVVVCVPWLRNGGADLVACLLTDAIAEDPTRRVLFLRCDHPHFERPDWVPAGVDVVDISDVVARLSWSQAEEFFYTLLLGLAPKQVFNVNSNLCWRVFARFGARLARSIDLYSYLFCWDHDEKGNRVGYPSDFFVPTASHLAGIFTDTEYLRDELFKMHLPPEGVKARVSPLFSPVREMPADGRVMAEVAAARPRPRPRVLWAGRLDPQKRFDLVLDAARQMPDVDFDCWGGAVLAQTVAYDLPANLRLNGFFKGYDELRLDDADAWLFTSDWEGMPTLIIELGIRGVPIVASAVGGVPELVDETTGFPVASGSEASAYVAALRQAIADPAERVRRAGRLQARTSARHTRGAYRARLSAILDKGR